MHITYHCICTTPFFPLWQVWVLGKYSIVRALPVAGYTAFIEPFLIPGYTRVCIFEYKGNNVKFTPAIF